MKIITVPSDDLELSAGRNFTQGMMAISSALGQYIDLLYIGIWILKIKIVRPYYFYNKNTDAY